MFTTWIDTWSNLMFLADPAWGASALGELLAPQPKPASVRKREGDFLADSFFGAQGALHYKLYVPSGYSGQALPLLVMLHGCGQDADDFSRGTRMNALAEKWQCFVVYPEQSSGANGARCWNWFERDNQHRDRGEPALIVGVTRKVISECGIDRSQVFVAGLSSGGAMAVILSQTYPELFAAVGCHSGLAYASATSLSSAIAAMRDGADPGPPFPRALPMKRIPIIVFHGDCDSTVHPINGSTIIAQHLAPSRSGGQYHERRHVSVHTGQATGRPYTRHVHRNHRGESVAEQWIVHGSGHAWSGGSARGSYTDEGGPDAGVEMMRFFMPGTRRKQAARAAGLLKALA